MLSLSSDKDSILSSVFLCTKSNDYLISGKIILKTIFLSKHQISKTTFNYNILDFKLNSIEKNRICKENRIYKVNRIYFWRPNLNKQKNRIYFLKQLEKQDLF